MSSVTLEQALALLLLPREVGLHPDDGQPVIANAGPYGPYVQHGELRATLGKAGGTAEEVDLDTALALLAAKGARADEKTVPLRHFPSQS